MEILRLLLLVTHFLGLAAIIGVFFFQMRASSGFAVHTVLAGAITQVASGLALVAVNEIGDLAELNNARIAVKLVVAVAVLVAAIVAVLQNRKGGRVKPWFHAAGGLAVVNVFVAVLWQ